MTYKTISFSEKFLTVRTLTQETDFFQALRLRHDVFSRRLGWVAERPDGLEMDIYDLWGTSLGVFDHQTLRGVVRIIPADHTFMLETEPFFHDLLPAGHVIRKQPDTAELTRLTAVGEHRRSDQTLAALLYKGVYTWCLLHQVRFLYFVVEARYMRALQLAGFPCQALVEPDARLGKSRPVAVLLDWDRFRNLHREKNPAFLAWMSTAVPAIQAWPPWQRPVNVSRPPFLPARSAYDRSLCVD